MNHPDNLPPLEPGLWVHSMAVGREPAFIGRIVRLHAGGSGWTVRCPEGRHWHRTPFELRPARPSEIPQETTP